MEQRKFSRIDFYTKFFLLHKKQRIEAKLLDISLKGALIQAEEALLIHQGDTATLEIQLGESGITLNIEAVLVHICKGNFGFKFTSMDLDSLCHLKQLLAVNLGNTEQIDRELLFLSYSES